MDTKPTEQLTPNLEARVNDALTALVRLLARQAAREAFNSNKLSKVKSDVDQ